MWEELTPLSRVLLETVIVTQLVYEFPEFYVIQTLIVHRSLPLETVMSQMNQDHTLKYCLFNIHFNMILPSIEWLSQVASSFQVFQCMQFLPVSSCLI
jgi:hypothetical protein